MGVCARRHDVRGRGGDGGAAFPDQPFDWIYTVISELASRKHNPEGGRWFSSLLGLSMLALWPVVSCLRETVGERRWPILALRAGILFGVAVGVERLTFVRFSSLVNNGHEALAVGTFAGLYTGLLRTLLAAIPARLDRRAGRGGAAGRDLHHPDRALLRPARSRLGRPPLAGIGRFAVAELRVLAVARRRAPVDWFRASVVVVQAGGSRPVTAPAAAT